MTLFTRSTATGGHGLLLAGAPGALLAALLSLAIAPPAGAQEASIDSPFRWIPHGLRVGVTGGYLNTSRGSLPFGPGPTGFVGARFRARVSSPLSIELGVGLGNSSRFVLDPRLETGPAPVDTVSSTWLSTLAAIQVALTGARTWQGIQPYLLLGGGFVSGLDEERSEVFADTALADFRYKIGTAPVFQGGLGTELRPSSRVGLGFEVRNHLFRLKAPDGFFRAEVLQAIEDAGAPAPEDTQWPSHLELSVTLWYSF